MGKKEIIERSGMKKDLKKELLRDFLPGIFLLLVIYALMFLLVRAFDFIIYTIFVSILTICSFAYYIKATFNSIEGYIKISSNKFTVVTDKLYRVDVGANNSHYVRGARPPKDMDNNLSGDIYHFSRYGSFIPKIKDQRTAFSGDEFYLVVLDGKSKKIIKAYNATFYTLGD